MSTKDYAIIVALIMVAVLVSVSAGYAAKVGDAAPDFKLGSLTGEGQIQLNKYFDKPTVLVFWASWCPHCQKELPVLQGLFTNMKGKINVLGVSLDDNKDRAQSCIKKHSISFPNAFVNRSESDDIVKSYGLSGIPALFVIDKGGKITSSFAGEVDKESLKKELDKLGVK
jgi:peroxiredoxin